MEVDINTLRTQLDERFSAEDFEHFQKNGFVIVRGLGQPEMCRRMLDVTLDGLHRLIGPIEYEADLQYPGAPPAHDAPGGRTARRLKQAHSRDTVFTEWITSPAVTGRLRQILGPELVCPLAHHNCIMTKQPEFSSDTGWHQDIRYWSFTRPDLVNVWLALGSERQENGGLRLIPGSHVATFPRSSFDDDLFFRDDLEENQPWIDSAITAELGPGDVVFFHCRLLHAASRNYTTERKYSVVFTFRAADNPPISGTRSARLPELLIH